MRHGKKTIKLGRKSEHRNLLLANQVCSLIEHSRIRTKLAKAKAVRPFAEKMITLGKRGDLHSRLRFRVRPAPARQPLRLRRCRRSKLFPGKMSWSWRRHPVLLTSYACGLRPRRRRFNNL